MPTSPPKSGNIINELDMNAIPERSKRKDRWSLEHEVTALVELLRGTDKKEIRKIFRALGRSQHGITYKCFENQTSIVYSKGYKKLQIRSVLKYIYVDHTSPNLVRRKNKEEVFKAMFKAHDADFQGMEQVKEMYEATMAEYNRKKRDVKKSTKLKKSIKSTNKIIKLRAG